MKRVLPGYSLLDNNSNYWNIDDVHLLERNLSNEQAWLVLVIAKFSNDEITSDSLDDIILEYVLPNIENKP